jgi:hypothetical protein
MNPPVPLEELRAIARAIALDADLDVQIGAPGSGWHIHATTGLINVDGGDLASAPADDVRGLVCHEAAHAAITRYLHMVPATILSTPGLPALLNSLEDCRIEDWLAARYPGTAAWIALYNERLFPEHGDPIATKPWFSQFCLGAIHEWWHGRLPSGLAPAPAAALAATTEARSRYIACQPPIEADVPASVTGAYAASRVSRLFADHDRYTPPDGFERAVRLSAYEAWRVAWQDIRPIYDALVARDLKHASQMKSLEQAFLRHIGELRHAAPIGRSRRRVRIPADISGLPAVITAQTDPEAGEIASLPETDRVALQHATTLSPSDAYERARQSVASTADRLFNELERLLRPDSYPRWIHGHPSGMRLNLRGAMTFDAEPGAYLRLWDRKTLPRRRDPVFLLLLDLSGSMRGERIQHGFHGVVLFTEVLHRLGIRFEVDGYQDVLIPFKSFAEPLDAAARQTIGTMPLEVTKRRPGGRNRPIHNWDGPVLLSAADRLMRQSASSRVLLVVSDGLPSGPNDGESALKAAIHKIETATDIALIGVGLGPDTDHVADFFPHHHARLPLEAVPTTIGATIERLLGA